jgi:hypothetical protein
VEGVSVTNERFLVGAELGIAVLILVLFSAAFAQKVVRPDQISCSEEIVRSNLELKERTLVSGVLRDPTGAPFADSPVVLKVADNKGKFVSYRAVATDKDGRFDLGVVDAGKYRFLPAPNRGFKQPTKLGCAEGHGCEMSLVLQVSPTDQPFVGCPIQ